MSQEETQNKKIAQSINGFSQLHARQQTIHTWSVLSHRNSGLTAHKVDTRELTCTCEDMEYNTDGSEVCDHIAAALYQQSANMDVGTALNFDLHERITEVETAAGRLEQKATTLSSEIAAQNTAEPYPGDESAGAEPEEVDTTPSDDAQAAADKLKDAFDDAVDDMRVQASGGAVFFQTGKDTPEDWPYPGGSETFKVLTGPDMVKYVHDGTVEWADSPHELYDYKPGEWWKNALDPEDVDDYINQVLS